MLDDTKIIELFHQRNESAIEETDRKYGRLLNRVSNNIVQNEQDAEECVSDTYISTWNTIPPQKPNSLKMFLLKIVRNISINKFHHTNRKKRGGGEYTAVFEELDTSLSSAANGTASMQHNDIADEIALRDALNRFLECLPESQRAVFIGRYWYFESITEIADNLNMSPSNVKMILLRCRKSLMELLQKEGFML